MIVDEAIRILVLSMLSFIVALAITPLILRLLTKYSLTKQIRALEAAPIYFRLHQKKEGTPTMGGVIIWGVVLGLALVFWILDSVFSGIFSYLNFVDRAQTYLPIAAMAIGKYVCARSTKFKYEKIPEKTESKIQKTSASPKTTPHIITPPIVGVPSFFW